VKKTSATMPAVILAALALSSVPYLVAYAFAPADRRFMGIVSSVADWSQYLAWLRAFADHFVIENVLTCEPQSPAFFNLQWLFLARLAAWLPAAVVLQGFRLLVGAGFLWLTHRVCREYFRGNEAATWLGWLLINFSSGLGWIWVLEKRMSGLTDARHPMDIYVYEPVTFQNLIVFPHFLFAAALLLLIFRLVGDAIDKRRMDRAWLAGLLALVLGLSHAYDLIVVYAVLGVFVLCLFRRDGFAWRPLLVTGLIGAMSAPAPAYFLYLTTRDPLWSQVLAQFRDAGVFTPAPHHLLILVGMPLLLVLGTWRNVFPRAWPASWPLLVRVWAVVNVLLLYIPADYQIHMLSGWQIPLGLLAAEGVFGVLVPRLAARGWIRNGAPPSRLAVSRRGLVVLIFLLSVPTNLYLLAWRVLEVRKLQHTHYLYRDEIESAAWLERNSSKGDVVFASLVLSEYVPFLSGNKVFLGHWAQTVNFRDKRNLVARFYSQQADDAERRRILASCNVRYVLHGRAERELGGFDPARAPYLELVRTEGETKIYRVGESVERAAASDTGAPEKRSPAWSEPIWLSQRNSTAWFPAIVADAAGAVHVFWSSGRDDADIVMYCRIGAGGCSVENVAAARTVMGDGYYVTRPSAVADPGGELRLLWRPKHDILFQTLSLADPEAGWSDARRLGEGTYNTLVGADGGGLHAFWSASRQRGENDPCAGCSDITHSASFDGGATWSRPALVADTLEGSVKPDAATHGGDVYVVWEEGHDFYVGKGNPAAAMFAASLDGGRTWQAAQSFSPLDKPLRPAVAALPDGTLVVVWSSTVRGGVFSQVSRDRGATWSPPHQIGGLQLRYNAPDELDSPDLAVDSAGRVHFVVAGRTNPHSQRNAIYHLTGDGESWSEPEMVFDSDGAPEWPRLAIGNGNELHLVWFERNAGQVWDSEKSRYRIWYSHARTDAPAIPAVTWPAPSRLRVLARNRIVQVSVAAALVALAVFWVRRRRG